MARYMYCSVRSLLGSDAFTPLSIFLACSSSNHLNPRFPHPCFLPWASHTKLCAIPCVRTYHCSVSKLTQIAAPIAPWSECHPWTTGPRILGQPSQGLGQWVSRLHHHLSHDPRLLHVCGDDLHIIYRRKCHFHNFSHTLFLKIRDKLAF